ncbi:thermonuclease family protein [Nonomuraea lactucae]|uniref:thermonuclease family protein n=1 Tax=Nonomuraea lactucae TaxID=2249762 RepID=UPI000DE1D847|nr:excalibur calcium-binding domain-containing protein [Nonomuraea lactucae]
MRLRPTLAAGTLAVAALLPAVMTLPAGATAAPAGVPKGAVAAKIVKIVDGDTVDVRRGGRTMRVRLLEVDTPERGRCWYRTATARTKALLPVGKTAYLLADKEPRDRYGRWLFYAFNGKGVHVNRHLVRYGYGKAVLFRPNDRYIKVMRAEQARAQRERLRIWSGKCDGAGTAPTGNDPRFRTCGEANAAGYGPYTRGRDPEYAWYQDRDGDGVVCER